MIRNIFTTVLLSIFFTTSVLSQITLKRNDFAVSGRVLDSARFKILTREGAVKPTGGNNQTWDYTNLKDSNSTVFTYYYTPASTFGAIPGQFSDATLAYNYNSTFQIYSFPSRAYERLDSTGYYDLGFATNGASYNISLLTGSIRDSIIIPAVEARHSSPRTFYKFPITNNASWKSNFLSGTDFFLTIGVLGLNKTPGQRISYYNYRDTIIGWGTLRLKNPAGGNPLSFAVLLHQRNGSRIDSFFLSGQPAPTPLLSAFGLQQGALAVTPTLYQFLGVGFNEPHMYMSVSSTGAINLITRAGLPNQGLTVKTKEADYSIATKVFPNPTTEGVTFEFDKKSNADWHIMIYNTMGAIIQLKRINAPQGLTNQYLELEKSMPSGTYFYNLMDETSLIRASGKFVLQRF
jgi:hypothetical protein